MSAAMADATRAQIDASLAQLNALTRRGREIRNELAIDPSAAAPLAAARMWQHDCAAAVSQLSGGSKAHWLSRAYSGALLVRSSDGGAVVQASVAEIVDRVLDVLDRAAQSLTQPGAVSTTPADTPAPRRFDFVRHEPLRPVLEQAYADSGRALDEGDFTRSLMTSCGILEAIITDALEHSGRADAARSDGVQAFTRSDGVQAFRPAVADLSFSERIAAAEQSGLIRGGCARLPRVAREYRSIGDTNDHVVSERDARVTRQVLHVVLRDLDPGR